MTFERLLNYVNAANDFVAAKKQLSNAEELLSDSETACINHLEVIFRDYLSAHPEIPKEKFYVRLNPAAYELKQSINPKSVLVEYVLGEQKYSGDWEDGMVPVLKDMDVSSKFSEFIEQHRMLNIKVIKLMGSLGTPEEKNFYQDS